MSKCENNDNDNDAIGRPSKLQKTSDERTPALEQNPSPAIFNPNVIACFKLFDYLSLEDIHAMGQTCKQLNHFAGTYFQENYLNGYNSFWYEEIECTYRPISTFSQYMKTINIDFEKLYQFKYVEANCKSLEEISFHGTMSEIYEDKIECIKEKLANKIKSINLYDETPNGFYAKLFSICSNIKSISIQNFNSIETTWMHQKYPTLEHLDISRSCTWRRIEDFKIFFEQNPNIRSFGCDVEFLVENEDWLLTANTTFENIFIVFMTSMSAKRVHSLVGKLHERGFYKKLSLIFISSSQRLIDNWCKLPAVVRLSYCKCNITKEKINFPVMADVKYLNWKEYDIMDTKSIKNSLSKFPNIEQIKLFETKLHHLLVIIGKFKELKEIIILFYMDKNKKINLWALNKERAKLSGAGKVTIYVNEHVYLATKWAYNYRDFKFVELKRWESQRQSI